MGNRFKGCFSPHFAEAGSLCFCCHVVFNKLMGSQASKRASYLCLLSAPWECWNYGFLPPNLTFYIVPGVKLKSLGCAYSFPKRPFPRPFLSLISDTISKQPGLCCPRNSPSVVGQEVDRLPLFTYATRNIKLAGTHVTAMLTS